MSTFEHAFNKGIPTDLDIDVAFSDMINMATDKKAVNEILVDGLVDYNNKLSNVIGKSIKFFFGNKLLRISTDLNTLDKKISLSPHYLEGLVKLNLCSSSYFFKKNGIGFFHFSLEDASNRLELLRTVRSASQLEKNFPGLYQSFRDIKRVKGQLDKAKGISGDCYRQVVEYYRMTELDLEFFDKFNSVSDFIQLSYSTLKSILENYEQLKDVHNEQDLSKDLFNYLPIDRLELYLASYFLDYANEVSDIFIKQKCMYYVSTYMFENRDKMDEDVSFDRLISNVNNKPVFKRISRKELYEKFKNILVNNPELYNINFDSHIFSDMSMEEIEKLMAEYMRSVQLKWEILPDDDTAVVADIISSSSNGNNGSESSSTKRSSVKRDPIDLFMEKKEFFDSSDPFVKVMGKDTFDGYVGYIYPNGTVILDKFYENAKTRKLAEEQAIYCMKLDDFYLLSQLSKSAIIAGKLCKRFYHRGDWQSRVQKELVGTAKSEVAYKTKLLELINLLK